MDVVLNILILLVIPFVFIGFINRVKAIWAGKKGTPIFQSFFDFIKLLKKGEVISNSTSFLFKIAPSIYLASIIFASLLVPIINQRALIFFPGDFILFSYILGLGKLFTIILAMDTGSSFEGMGASREITFSTFVEPVFFIIFGSLALITGKTSFVSIFELLNNNSGIIVFLKILTIITLFEMILVEGSRVPIDDPNTHLELTMIHEVMVLDNSGPDLAFIQYGSALKMTAFSLLIANLTVPLNINIIYSAILFVAVTLTTSILIGFIESLSARYKLNRVPQFLFFMTSIAVIIFSILAFIKGN